MEATGKAAALAETSKRLDKVKSRGCLLPQGRVALVKQDGQKVKKCKQKRMLVALFDQQMKTFE